MTSHTARTRIILGTAVTGLALALDLGLAVRLGLSRPMQSDALQFRSVAQNVAAGRGYTMGAGFWEGQPTMQRLPAWPLTVAAALKLAPRAPPDTVMRVTAVLVNAGVALMVFLLTLRLLGAPWLSALAAVAYAIHPTALYATDEGLSEPLFLLLTGGGACLLLSPASWCRFAAFLPLGLACLVRTNFVLWIGCFGLLAALNAWRSGFRSWRAAAGRAAAAAVLFALPVFAWAARNYAVCGHFPVLSTIRGQTYYGGNNAIVADTLKYWGYWVFPNSIPGERPLSELAATLSEYDVDVYYYGKGREFVRRNWFSMPRLWLGKFVRAYVPVPWKPGWGSYGVCAYRWLLYLGAAAGACLAWRRLPAVYRMTLVAMLVTSLATVLGFWGCARFAFAVEPFLLPLAVLGLFHAPALWRAPAPGPTGEGDRS